MGESRNARASRRICLVSPGHVSFNPRLVKEADALQAAGYQVHVVAAGNVSHLRTYDSEIFCKAKWTWETVSYASEFHRQFLRVRRKLARAFVTRGARNLTTVTLAHHLLAKPLAKAVMRCRADLYIAHYVASIPVVAAAAARHGALAGFDAEDFHTGEFDDTDQTGLDATIVKVLEKAYLPTFAHFTAASPGIASAYASLFPGISPVSILNVFPLDHAPPCPSATQRVQGRITAHWFSQTIGENRGLEAVLLALSRARCHVDFYIRGTWQAGYRQKFMAHAKRLGVHDRIHELPLIAPAQIERAAAAYDIGLVCETGHSENRQIALTNKIFSYMLAGLVIFATEIRAHCHLKSTGVGMHLYKTDDAEALARLFERLAEDPIGLAKLRVQTWNIAQSCYNWDFEKTKLVSAIDKVFEF